MKVSVVWAALVVVLIVFESGRHSVHHLGKADDAAACAPGGVSAHGLLAETLTMAADLPRFDPVDVAAESEATRRSAHPTSTSHERAPPA